MHKIRTIDFPGILEIANKGVRRAAVFLGLGVNAAVDEGFKAYQLTRLANIQLIPDEVGEDTIQHFKEEFRVWIEAAGFRELAETFNCFLDALFEACYIIEKNKQTLNIYEFRKSVETFAKEGMPNKLNVLSQNFSVCSQDAKYVRSLGKARNCLTHRRGIVGEKDLDASRELKVVWVGLDISAVTESGRSVDLNVIPEGGVRIDEGAQIQMQLSERGATFSKGERVNFSTHQLAEICWFYMREAQSLVKSAEEYARSQGIVVGEEQTDE